MSGAGVIVMMVHDCVSGDGAFWCQRVFWVRGWWLMWGGCLKENRRICGSFIIKLYEANSLMKQYGKKGSKEKGISM